MNLDKISVVILAGGLGTRLRNFRGSNATKVLLKINGIPMIIKQIEQVISWGFNLNNIVCVTNPSIHVAINKVTRDKFGTEIKYVIQPEPLGISHAFSFAKDIVTSDYVLLVLGDNFFEQNPFKGFSPNFDVVANIFTKNVENPKDFGVAEVSGDRIISLEEKPKVPLSNLAVVGVYLYRQDVFEKIKSLKPSQRGEYEITDLNKILIDHGGISFKEINGWWIDAGTPERIMELEEKID